MAWNSKMTGQDIKERKKPIIFIKTFSKGKGANVEDRFIESISQQFYLKAQDYYSNRYDVNDESVMKVLNKKYSELISKNCDADKCMEQIAENVKAKFSVYGDIEDHKDMDNTFIMKVTNISRTDDGEMTTRSFSFTFQNYQRDYYIQEVIKSIEDSNYRPNPNNAPKGPNQDIKISQLTFKPVEAGKLPDISQVVIQGNDFQKYQEVINKANDLMQKKNYLEASREYLRVIDNIQKKEEEDKKRLQKYTELCEIYFSDSINAYHKSILDQTAGEILNDSEDENKLDKISKNLLESFKTYKEYKSPKYPKKTYILSIEDAYEERIDLIQLQSFRIKEKKVDQIFYKKEFQDAILAYKKILTEVQGAPKLDKQEEWIKLENSIKEKITTTQKNGEISLRTILDQLILSGEDLYDEYELSDRKKLDKAKESKSKFDSALQTMKNDSKLKTFLKKDMIEKYNRYALRIRSDSLYPDEFKPNLYLEPSPMVANSNSLSSKRTEFKENSRLLSYFLFLGGLQSYYSARNSINSYNDKASGLEIYGAAESLSPNIASLYYLNYRNDISSLKSEIDQKVTLTNNLFALGSLFFILSLGQDWFPATSLSKNDFHIHWGVNQSRVFNQWNTEWTLSADWRF
jgi:hypothetical protein